MNDYSGHTIRSVDELEDLYGKTVPGALHKELDHVSDLYRQLIEASPFVVLASVGPEGLDCSPRGDPPGFVRVSDAKTVMLPDRRGNNRLDTLRNIVRDPRVSLLFMIPGVGETLRINGTAELVSDPELCRSFEIQGKLPRSVIVVTVNSCYFQCQKALARSRLWDADAQVDRSSLPSAGDMVQATMPEAFDGAAYDRNYPEHMKKTIY
jgi:PPOX class probable FMN-dependent enzyme